MRSFLITLEGNTLRDDHSNQLEVEGLMRIVERTIIMSEGHNKKA